METVCFFIIAVISYLVGSLNFAIIVSKYRNDDVRNHGSKNAGLTNMLRTYGKHAAYLTFVGDFTKGILSIGVAKILCDLFSLSALSGVAGCFAMFFTIMGHMFPVYFSFKGGKGILSSAACLLMIDYRVFLIIISIFLVLVITTRMVSLSSIVAAVAAGISNAFFCFYDKKEYAVVQTVIIAIIAVSVILKHRTNIVRILNGTENKLSFKK